MRTSGPCLPSGRRSASTSRARVASTGSREQPAHVVGHGLGHRRGQLRVGARQRLVHEHHVGVAAVAELVAAVATHRDDRHPGRHSARRVRASTAADRRGQRRLEGGAGDVGQRVADLGDPERHAQVGDADPQQLAAADGPDRQRPRPRGRRAARRRPSSPPGPPRGPAARGAPRSPRIADALRLALEQVGGVAAGRQHLRHPLRGLALVAQQAEVPRRGCPAPRRSGGSRTGPASGSGASANHSSITGSRVRWICAVRVTPRGERLEVAQGGVGVEVAERGQPRLRGLGAQPRLVAGDPRHRGEQRAVEQLLVQPAHLALVEVPLPVELLAPGPCGSRASGRAGAARPRPRAPRAYAAAGRAGSGARACAGRRRRRAATARPRARRSRRSVSRASALRVVGGRTVLVGAAVHHLQQLDGELDVAQAARPELELPLGLVAPGCGRAPGGASPAPPRRSPSRSAADQTSGPMTSTYSRPSARSPATGRALSSAWNSQVFAQRS